MINYDFENFIRKSHFEWNFHHHCYNNLFIPIEIPNKKAFIDFNDILIDLPTNIYPLLFILMAIWDFHSIQSSLDWNGGKKIQTWFSKHRYPLSSSSSFPFFLLDNFSSLCIRISREIFLIVSFVSNEIYKYNLDKKNLIFWKKKKFLLMIIVAFFI